MTKPKFDLNLVSREVYDSARKATGSDDECDAMLYWLWCRAENVYSKEGVWHAVGDIANELVKTRTVDGKDAKKIYDQALEAAK